MGKGRELVNTTYICKDVDAQMVEQLVAKRGDKFLIVSDLATALDNNEADIRQTNFLQNEIRETIEVLSSIGGHVYKYFADDELDSDDSFLTIKPARLHNRELIVVKSNRGSSLKNLSQWRAHWAIKANAIRMKYFREGMIVGRVFITLAAKRARNMRHSVFVRNTAKAVVQATARGEPQVHRSSPEARDKSAMGNTVTLAPNPNYQPLRKEAPKKLPQVLNIGSEAGAPPGLIKFIANNLTGLQCIPRAVTHARPEFPEEAKSHDDLGEPLWRGKHNRENVFKVIRDCLTTDTQTELECVSEVVSAVFPKADINTTGAELLCNPGVVKVTKASDGIWLRLKTSNNPNCPAIEGKGVYARMNGIELVRK
jgi:hypothetical protein